MAFNGEEAREGLRTLFATLDAAGIPFFLTGALARNALASARTSEDFDLVLDMRGRTPDDVKRILTAAGHSPNGPEKNEFGERLVLTVAGVETDLWLAPDTATHRAELDHAIEIDHVGRKVRVMAPEDFVVRKLVTYGRIRRRSADLDDAYQVLLLHWDAIDRDRLIQRAEAHRLGALARELVDVVNEDRNAL